MAIAEAPVQAASPWSPELEAHLDRLGVKWRRLPRLRLAVIDRKASRANQARVEAPLDDDTVVLYGTAMEAGAVRMPFSVPRRGLRTKWGPRTSVTS